MKNKELIVSIILAVAFTALVLIGIGITSSSVENDVLIKDAVVYKGVETAPAEVRVEASYSKMWQDGKPSNFVIGLFIIIGALSQMAYAFWKGFTADSVKDLKFIGVLLISWGLSLGVIFGGLSKNIGSSQYEQRLTLPEYEKVKDNLDSLFPNK